MTAPAFTCVGALFEDREGKTSRVAAQLVGCSRSIDPAAVHSVLQLGAIVPPLAPWSGVSRIVPSSVRSVGSTHLKGAGSADNGALDARAAVARLVSLLDGQLSKIANPVVLFSGGVDSGLIAARLAAAGRTDALLVHFSFGSSDKETVVAREMATHLGMRIEYVSVPEEAFFACLRSPGTDYPLPFADESTAPMAALANHLVKRLAGEQATVIDGTGADGIFGMGNKVREWMRLLAVPIALRRAVALPFALGAWRVRGPLEYVTRLMRRSSTLSPITACIAQNSLSGILYDAGDSEVVCEALDKWIENEVGESLDLGMMAADVGLTCANIFAQKALPIFERSKVAVCFPYLNEDVFHLGMRILREEFSIEPKAILKQALKAHVPARMVDRPKTGFVDPNKELFYRREFVGILEEAVAADAPLRPFLTKKNVLRACWSLSRSRQLPQQTLNCLWAIAFTNRWYRTA